MCLVGLLDFASGLKDEKDNKPKKSKTLKGVENIVPKRLNPDIIKSYINMIANPMHYTWKFEDSNFYFYGF